MAENGHDFRVVGCASCYRDPSGKVWNTWHEYASSIDPNIAPPAITGISITPGQYGLAAVGITGGQVTLQQRTAADRIQDATTLTPNKPGEPEMAPPLTREGSMPPGIGYGPLDFNPGVSNLDWGRVGRGLLGAGIGFVTGGPGGAVAGAIAGYGGSGSGAGGLQGSSPCGSGMMLVAGNCSPIPTGGGAGIGLAASCPPGTVRVGTACVRLSAALPGGQPFTTQAGAAQAGMYGLAVPPGSVARNTLVCPPRWVLGDDNLCYRSLPKNRRKWRPAPKPLVSGGELNAIRTAARARKRIKIAARAVDLKTLTPAQAAKIPKRRKR